MPANSYTRIYAAIRKIPRGRVATYGQIAALAGLPRQARLVGYALFQQEVDSLPWHRVVNAQGKISYSPARQNADQLQRVLLEAEGVVFSDSDRIDLNHFRWQPGVKRRHNSASRKRPAIVIQPLAIQVRGGVARVCRVSARPRACRIATNANSSHEPADRPE